MILVLFYIREDALVWVHWNSSWDMPLTKSLFIQSMECLILFLILFFLKLHFWWATTMGYDLTLVELGSEQHFLFLLWTRVLWQVTRSLAGQVTFLLPYWYHNLMDKMCLILKNWFLFKDLKGLTLWVLKYLSIFFLKWMKGNILLG